MDLSEWVANHPDYAYVKELVAAGRLREAQQVEMVIILQWTERDS